MGLKEVEKMELSIKEPKNILELEKMLKEIGVAVEDVSVIVEGNIFSVDGKWLLKSKKIESQSSQTKLESIYGKIEGRDRELVDGMKRIILENVPGGVHVDIKKFLYAKLENPEASKKACILLSYIGILESVDKTEIEPDENSDWTWYPVSQIRREDLTKTTDFTYGKIRENEKEIQNILKSYQKFNQRNFEKYFFYGMENREVLLEGIIYYTNRNLTIQYLKIIQTENLLPIEKQLENLKRTAIMNCEQLYRFINLAEKEDFHFTCRLNEEEKKVVQKKVIHKIKQLIDDNMFLFFARGIFYDDRIHGEDPASIDRVNRIKSYSWTKEVYQVLEQLNYMQKINPTEYYRKWVQAKLSRLKVSGRYAEKDLAQIEEIGKIIEKGEEICT